MRFADSTALCRIVVGMMIVNRYAVLCCAHAHTVKNKKKICGFITVSLLRQLFVLMSD